MQELAREQTAFECEIDWRSPLDAFAPLANEPGAVLLHGGELAVDARWSFISSSPGSVVECRHGESRLNGIADPRSPFELLERLCAARKRETFRTLESPLAGAVIGYAGYESGALIEPTVAAFPSPYQVPDFFFGAYDAIACFDRVERRAFVSGRDESGVSRLKEVLGQALPSSPESIVLSTLQSNFTQERYEAAVAAVVEKIRNGDLFQANISQRLRAEFQNPFNPFAVFRAASAGSSAAFGAYMVFDRAAFLSLSPERFFKVSHEACGQRLIAEPIKGTRRRGENEFDDNALLQDLINDPKDRAENIMIADLMRNDFSRICKDHSIVEEAICEPVSLNAVHHLVSRIAGVLRDDASAASALAALFPPGSVTGAPKIEAMKVIAEIEHGGRGPYTGAIGYIADDGAADFSVAIRVAIATEKTMFIPVGGGVTLKSNPQAEYRETMDKARHILRQIGHDS